MYMVCLAFVLCYVHTEHFVGNQISILSNYDDDYNNGNTNSNNNNDNDDDNFST